LPPVQADVHVPPVHSWMQLPPQSVIAHDVALMHF
jgi:hypothetical protein